MVFLENAREEPDPRFLREWKGEIRIPNNPIVFAYDSHTLCRFTPINDTNNPNTYYRSQPFEPYKTEIFISGGYFLKDKRSISHALYTRRTILTLGELALQKRISAIGRLPLESYLHFDVK